MARVQNKWRALCLQPSKLWHLISMCLPEPEEEAVPLLAILRRQLGCILAMTIHLSQDEVGWPLRHQLTRAGFGLWHYQLQSQ